MRRTLFFLSLLLTALLLVVAVRGLFVTQYRVADSGGGLCAGDRVLVNRLAYGLRVPGGLCGGRSHLGGRGAARGDYVAFLSPIPGDRNGGHPVCVARVLAVPGDTLWFDAARRVLLAASPDGSASPQPVPTAGSRVEVMPWNARWLWGILARNEGGRTVLVGDSMLVLDGRKIVSVRFSQPYYWVGDGAGGFLVPHAALLGRAFGISYSIDGGAGGHPRWRMDRLFLPL